MKFIKDKCEVFHLGKHNPGVEQMLGSTQLGISSMERVLVDPHLNMSEQYAAVTKKQSQEHAGLHQRGHHQQR